MYAPIRRITAFSFLVLTSAPLLAQDVSPKGMTWLIEPYLMFPNMKGDTGIRELPLVSVRQTPSDIFNNLEMGAMLYAEADDGNSTISTDFIYMKLGSDVEIRPPVLDGKVDVTQTAFELAWLKHLTEHFDLGVSAVYNRITADGELTLNIGEQARSRSAGISEDWIDPTIVARWAQPLGERWSLQVRGNVGGFGVGSELFLQLQANLVWRSSPRTQLSFGYRVIDIDYDRGEGANRFVYDMTTFGPVVKFGFRF